MKKTVFSAAFLAGTVAAGSGHANAEQVAPPTPPATPSAAPAAPPTTLPASHTVMPGDDLWGIAKARLGVPERWVEIYAVNRDVLRSPDRIEVGQVLEIPSTPVAVPSGMVASRASSSASPNRAATPRRARVRTRPPTVRRTTGGRTTGGGGGGDLAAIRSCESGGNYRAVSPSGQYRGAYQFDQRTWRSVGGSGDPAAASPAEQDARARILRSQRGSSPWGNCA